VTDINTVLVALDTNGRQLFLTSSTITDSRFT